MSENWEDLLVRLRSGQEVPRSQIEAAISLAQIGAYEGYLMSGETEAQAEKLASDLGLELEQLFGEFE